MDVIAEGTRHGVFFVFGLTVPGYPQLTFQYKKQKRPPRAPSAITRRDTGTVTLEWCNVKFISLEG
eukprot:1394795-Rhodomonas_salina.2